MAALPENTTNRIFVDYVTGNSSFSTEHTAQFRFGDAENYDTLQLRVLDLLTAIGLGNLFAGWRALRVRGQTSGTDFSFPIPLNGNLGAFVGTGSPAGYNETHEAIETAWVGRSAASGRRAKISIYGVRHPSVLTAFRFPVGGTSPAWVGSTVNSLNAVLTPWVAIDGVRPQWYAYVNVNYNSYWEGRKRTT